MIITFHPAMADAILAGEKTVTRRQWKDSHAAKFKAGAVVDAWRGNPRNGGEKFAQLKITSVTYEANAAIPMRDYWLEGFHHARMHGWSEVAGHFTNKQGYQYWRDGGGFSWVVRFEVVP